MNKTKVILKVASIALTIGGAALSVINSCITDKVAEIEIAEQVAEYIANGMKFKRGA